MSLGNIILINSTHTHTAFNHPPYFNTNTVYYFDRNSTASCTEHIHAIQLLTVFERFFDGIKMLFEPFYFHKIQCQLLMMRT